MKRQQALGRRSFLQLFAASAGAALASSADKAWAFNFLEPVHVENPLAAYPNRSWEGIYRDLYAYDSTFTFTCAPNDTHNCLLTAYVRSGTVVRLGPTFRYGEATDLGGPGPSHRWDPRCCQKGLALVRRFYGDRRCKYPLVRKGWLEWVKAGTPRDPATGKVDPKYLNRGKDPFVRVSWEDAFELVAQGLQSVAAAYNGEQGKKWLTAQGFDPAMVDATKGAGTQVIKMRGGMPLLGVTRIFAQYRFANTLASWTRTRARSSRRTRSAPAAGTTTPGTPICPPGTRWSAASRPSTGISRWRSTATCSCAGASTGSPPRCRTPTG